MSRAFSLAGFEVTLIGRFWVTPEGYGAVLNFCGLSPDGDAIHDWTARVSKDTRVLRAAYAAFGSQVPQQLFFQHSSRLNE